MEIKDDKLLSEIRTLPCCWCGKAPPNEAAHVITKGMGGGNQIDHPHNVAPLCRDCHQSHHDGHRPITVDLWAMIAEREGVPPNKQAEMQENLYAIARRSRKDLPPASGDHGQGKGNKVRPQIPTVGDRDRSARMDYPEDSEGRLRW